jgi:hypothetical protein
MQLIAAILFFVAITMAISEVPRGERLFFQDRARAIATQMSWYHNQAVIQCSSPNPACQPGVINVNTLSLPSSYGPIFSNWFIAGTDGNTVVTTWQANNVPSAGAGIAGDVAASLKNQSNGSVFAGAYNYQQQTIGVGYVFYYDNNLLQEPSIFIPPGFGGLSLTNGQPVLATPLN